MRPAPHRAPQVPQLAGSAPRSVQASPQRELPDGQPQFPAVQLVPPLHTLPHAPQLAGSRSTSTHVALHGAVPAGHAQFPAEHCWALGQSLEHVPQCAGFRSRSTQAPLQFVVLGGHVVTQAPVAHAANAPHAWPQEPQFFGSVEKSTHAEPQLENPDVHAHFPD